MFCFVFKCIFLCFKSLFSLHHIKSSFGANPSLLFPSMSLFSPLFLELFGLVLLVEGFWVLIWKQGHKKLVRIWFASHLLGLCKSSSLLLYSSFLVGLGFELVSPCLWCFERFIAIILHVNCSFKSHEYYMFQI